MTRDEQQHCSRLINCELDVIFHIHLSVGMLHPLTAHHLIGITGSPWAVGILPAPFSPAKATGSQSGFDQLTQIFRIQRQPLHIRRALPGPRPDCLFTGVCEQRQYFLAAIEWAVRNLAIRPLTQRKIARVAAYNYPIYHYGKSIHFFQ
jgi:hypothetical protein